MGLAVPYSSVRTGNVYLTSAQDLIIDSVRVATLGNVLPANIGIPYQPTVDVFGHNLRDTYMAHSLTRDTYKQLITDEFASLKTVAPATQWAPTMNGIDYVLYGRMMWNPSLVQWDGTVVPAYYWYYLPDLSGGWSGYINGSLAQATTQALTNAKACYNLHIAETKRRRALGDFNAVMLPGGCWGNLWHPYSGTWWPYSGDGAPVFRAFPAWDRYDGSVDVTAGATCRN